MRLKIKILTNIFCILPFLWLSYNLFINPNNYFGVDPSKEIIHFLGLVSLTILVMLFSLKTIQKNSRFNSLLGKLHPILAGWVIFYLLLHILAYFSFELAFDAELFIEEITTKNYLILGILAFIIILFSAIIMWRPLKKFLSYRTFLFHQMSYLALLLATIHFIFSVKSFDLTAILFFIFAVLILLQKMFKLIKRKY